MTRSFVEATGEVTSFRPPTSDLPWPLDVPDVGLQDAGVEPKEINEVLLVGGMTRMPKAESPLDRLCRFGPICDDA